MIALPCLCRVGCKLRMVNLTRRWLNKIWNKDQQLVAFLANKPHQPKKKPCMSSYRTMLYPVTGKSCWVLVYSALLVALFSGTNFEDLFASLTWPCTLPPGWSVEWDCPSAGADHPPAEWRFRTGFIDASCYFASCLLMLPLNNETCIIWVDGTL